MPVKVPVCEMRASKFRPGGLDFPAPMSVFKAALLTKKHGWLCQPCNHDPDIGIFTVTRLHQTMIRSVVLSCLICFFHLSLAERLLLTEPFESVTLQPHGGEGMGNDRVWSLTTPPGWSLNDAGVPAGDGRPGWGGWRFVDGAWWKTLRDDPWRGLFRRAGGTLLVADADAWSAESRVPSTMTSFLSTPPIPISHLTAERFEVRFDSSWHPVAPMAGNLSVSFDGMPAVSYTHLTLPTIYSV